MHETVALDAALLATIASALERRQAVPYFGPGMLTLARDVQVPRSPLELAERMTAAVPVPFRIRKRLTQAAQFIENFRYRKSLVALLDRAFAVAAIPSDLQRALARLAPPFLVDTWYDDTTAAALAEELAADAWQQIQGLSQAEHFGTWTARYDSAGQRLAASVPAAPTLLYKPSGGHLPAGNYLVSDSDYVEVLTEIDIQTPLPEVIQRRRTGKNFVFLGCRFDDQLPRNFARQIMKRSSSRHWAVLEEAPTRMEARFLDEQRITRIACSLAEFARGMVGHLAAPADAVA